MGKLVDAYRPIVARTPIEMREAVNEFPLPAKLHEKYPNAFTLRVGRAP